MTLDVRIDLGAVPQALVDNARGQPRLVHGLLDAAVNAAGPYLWRYLALYTPRGATGLLAQNAYFERTLVGGKPQGFVGYRGAPSLYAAFVDQPTRPHFPPVEPLAYWAARKFGYAVGSSEAKRLGFLVARKISRRGTTGAGQVAKTATDHRLQAQTLMVRAAVEQVRRFMATGQTRST